MKDVAKIFAYFAGVVLLGALLAPGLFLAGHAVAARGMFAALDAVPFQRYFNRAELIAAVVLLWPVVRSLRIGGRRDLGIERDALWRRRALAGFVIGAGVVGGMALIYLQFGIYHLRRELPWEQLPMLLLSALTVGVIEECLFRGGILGIFRRTLQPCPALVCATFVFAVVHFLKPDEKFVIADVTWTSGFAMVPHVFHQFAEPMTVLASFSTIFVLGWILGCATMRSRSLWMGIGLHAGVVFAKMSFAKFSKRDALHLPWIGAELQAGLVPVAMLALAGVLAAWWLRHEHSATHR